MYQYYLLLLVAVKKFEIYLATSIPKFANFKL